MNPVYIQIVIRYNILKNRNIHIFQTPMYCKQTNLPGYSNRFFQLRFAQEKFNEIQCKLLERIQCVELQFQHMEKLVLIKSGEESQQVKLVRKQFQGIEVFSQELRAKATEFLLRKQTLLEEQAQRRDITKQYEQRLVQLDSVVYSKQVDISADHVGKLNQEKPTSERVNKLSTLKNQLNITMSLLQKMSSMRRDLGQMKQKNIPVTCSSQPVKKAIQKMQESDHEHKKNSYKTQSAITKQSSSSSSNQSNPQIEHKKLKKGKKMLLINSQSKIYDNNIVQIDPQMIKVGHYYKIEKLRSEKLTKQYEKLMESFTSLCMENKELSNQYRRIFARKKEFSQNNCSILENGPMVDALN